MDRLDELRKTGISESHALYLYNLELAANEATHQAILALATSAVKLESTIVDKIKAKVNKMRAKKEGESHGN